jgi:hypothetical protein
LTNNIKYCLERAKLEFKPIDFSAATQCGFSSFFKYAINTLLGGALGTFWPDIFICCPAPGFHCRCPARSADPSPELPELKLRA